MEQEDSFIRNTTECKNLINVMKIALNASVLNFDVNGIKISNWKAILLLVGFGLFATILAHGFNLIRSSFYKSMDTLDTAFDAGGKVSFGLTATTIVSQWTWAATLLSSSGIASKVGISGSFWYAAGATVQILLFAMLSVQLKIRAPGAKTFLQLIKARFGTKTHITFCVFGFTTNIIVTSTLMLGGMAVMSMLVENFTIGYGTLLIVAIVGIYTWIGGLGATFYVSYFNTAIIFLIMLMFSFKVYHDEESIGGILGSSDRVYELLFCAVAPKGNQEGSFLTIVSESGLVFGICNIVGNLGTVFMDQSYWQSSVAAKPKDGVWGFLAGGLVWFAVPFTFATTMGFAYIALSVANGAPLLSEEDVNRGLVPPAVAKVVMGKSGEFLMLLLILMAVTSTGSAEVIAVTSMLVYDVYQIYIKPFRTTTDSNSCILCGRQRGRWANRRDKCTCESMTLCKPCKDDDKAKAECKRAVKPQYKCRTHGEYRAYYDLLSGLKNWCLLWSSLAIIPLTALLYASQISLGWLFLFMGNLIGSAAIPIALCTFWSRLTGVAMMAGAVSGSIFGVTVWLVVASQYPGGLSAGHFLQNTGRAESMLWGNLTSILSSGVITVIVSMATNFRMDSSKSSEIWESTRDIDNPLFPWTELYARELGISGANKLGNRPNLEDVEKTFRNAKWIANIGAVALTLFLIVIWPAAMMTAGVLNVEGFQRWVMVSETWAFLAAIFIILVPIYNEVAGFREQILNKASVGDEQSEKQKINVICGAISQGTQKQPEEKTNIDIIKLD